MQLICCLPDIPCSEIHFCSSQVNRSLRTSLHSVSRCSCSLFISSMLMVWYLRRFKEAAIMCHFRAEAETFVFWLILFILGRPNDVAFNYAVCLMDFE